MAQILFEKIDNIDELDVFNSNPRVRQAQNKSISSILTDFTARDLYWGTIYF